MTKQRLPAEERQARESRRAAAERVRAAVRMAPTERSPAPWLRADDRAPLAIASILAASALARAALAFPHSMAAWGLNLLRFVPPIPGWTLWALSALAIVPVFARRAQPWVIRAFEWRTRQTWIAYAPWALAAATTVWLLPDRLYFVGDFMLRETSSNSAVSIFRTLYPQGLPLDAFLHDSVVRALAPALAISPHDVGRVLGALEAGVLGCLACHLSRVLDLRGAAAFAASSLVSWGGYVALFCGYDKAFAELVLITVAIGVFGLDVVRRGRGLTAIGIALGMGLVLHRLAIALLPAWFTIWALWLRSRGAGAEWRRPATVVAAVIPLAVLAVMGPRLAHLAAGFDTRNFLGGGVGDRGGVFRAAFSGTRLADLLDITVVLSPLAPIALMAPLVARRSGRRREQLVIAALVVPLVAFPPFFHPPQGLFRDWDALAPTGAALSLAAAWVAGETLRARARFGWLAVPVALGAFAPTAAWLLHHADVDRGLEQVEAFVHEPPPRTESERGTAWDFLGMRNLDLGRRDASAEAFARAAENTPSPKILRAWATSEIVRGDREHAREIYRRLLGRWPDDGRAWFEYATLSMDVADTAAARHAVAEVLRIRPEDENARRLLEQLDSLRHSP